MPTASDPTISFDQFFWLQDFAGRLEELGAPASSMQLITLGRTLYESSTRADPRSTADAVWARWPTQDGIQ
jgi:hypothetical protein